MQTKVVILAIVIALLATAFATAASKHKAPSPVDRLSKLIAQRADYLIFIGIPVARPTSWVTATLLRDGILEVKGHGTISISDVRAFVVAYPNRQLLDAEPGGLPLPEGLSELSPAARADSDLLHTEDLEVGKNHLQIAYAASATRPQDRSHYATALKNISGARIRVLRFAGYTRSAEGWKLSNVTRQFYSANEFKEWYGLGKAEWIEPGQTVTDPNNYGAARPVLWAYYCESASGKQFIAGAILE